MRLKDLDGLRGYLALMVVLSHVATLVWADAPGSPPPPDELTRLLALIGAPAVDAFFVISGIVVSLSLSRQPRPYLGYLKARARRLLPLGLVGLALSPLIRWCAQDLQGSVIITLLKEDLTPGDWLGVATAGLFPYEANHLNPPLWSLIVEQHVALLMPALVWVSASLPLSLLVMALALVTGWKLHSLWYVPAFLTGALIRNTTVTRRAAVLLGLLGTVLWQHRLLTGESVLYRQSSMLGAALMIVAIRSLPGSAVSRFLLHPVSQWLGKVSFSLYITHFAVLILGATLTQDPRLGAALMLPLTLPVAWLCWKFIEDPLGRRQTRAR